MENITPEIREIPILFSTMMVQAILEGRKTVTRRVIKHPTRGIIPSSHHLGYMMCRNGNALLNGPDYPDGPEDEVTCPFGKIGDLLWVRETWYNDAVFGAPDYHYRTEGEFREMFDRYRGNDTPLPKGMVWKPSIHMPKTAARIWLQVTDVRVERLQDITEEQAKAEGVKPNCEGKIADCPACQMAGETCLSAGEYYHYTRDLDDFPAYSATESFESLWHSINGEDSWEANPYVWVIEFKVLSTTGKPAK